jgi:hypothetical protein
MNAYVMYCAFFVPQVFGSDELLAGTVRIVMQSVVSRLYLRTYVLGLVRSAF